MAGARPNAASAKGSPRPTVSSRSRKKKKVVVNYAAFLWLAVAINLFFGLKYSGVTRLRIVRIFGAQPQDQELLQSAVKLAEATPAAQINPWLVEGRARQIDSIKSAKFEKSLFGTGRLVLEYRKPVATVFGRKDVYLDSAGVLFTGQEPAVTLPQLKLSPDLVVLNNTLAVPFDARSIADLAERVSKLQDDKPPMIIVEESGLVCLNRKGTRIVLGTCDGIQAKMDRLSNLLVTRPEIFDSAAEINLMSPENPLMVPRNPSKTTDKPDNPTTKTAPKP